MLKNYNLRTWAEIDLDAVSDNFDILSSCLPGGIMKLAVVKADAYGHGACQIAKLLADKVDAFGVARADEALELRRAGILNTRILILGHTAPYHYPILFKYDLVPTIFNIREAEALEAQAVCYGQMISVHIALDTGMNRIGFKTDREGLEAVKQISNFEHIRIDGIFSHFADADNLDDRSYTELQLKRFTEFTDALREHGIAPTRHLYNSAGILTLPASFDMVREGICIYGLAPSDAMSTDITTRLRHAMSLRSEVIHIHTVPSGEGVSYGCRYVSDRPAVVATVCAGYADGVPRNLFRDGYVLINGKRAKITGAVCMDQFMCDVTGIENVEIGSVVTVFGADGDEYISADEVAKCAGTISYEILCGISKRVPRVYIKDGKTNYIHYGIPHEEY
ncbi:MAG: alanine racemase [Clostridia bacterium]|nr:alanine racemase [Clostridia bacterium]